MQVAGGARCGVSCRLSSGGWDPKRGGCELVQRLCVNVTEPSGSWVVRKESFLNNWKFGMRQLFMGKDPNSAILPTLWLCGHKSRTLREKARTIFHLIVTKNVEDEERTCCTLFSLFPFSRHAGCRV